MPSNTMMQGRKTFVQAQGVPFGTSGVLHEDESLGLVGPLQRVQSAIVSELVYLQLLLNLPCRSARLAPQEFQLFKLEQRRRLRPHHTG